MTRRLVFLLLLAFGCSSANPAVLELSISKVAGVVTPTDVVRLERRVLAIRGVTLVSVSAERDTLIIHHGTDTEMEQIEAVLLESGFRWAAVAD